MILPSQTELETVGDDSFHGDESKGTIVVYRRYFERLLAASKPLRDQLILELPVLEGIRTGEVSSLRVEYFNFESGDMQVLDSKKRKLFTIPLNRVLGQHAEQYIIENGLAKGDVLFYPEQKAGRKGTSPYLSWTSIVWVWAKWCEVAGIPYMSPRYGRAYFAVNWHVVEGKSLIGLMHILRHTSLERTQRYISRIYFYEDFKTEFHKGHETPFISECLRSDKCPVVCEGCYCKFFQPNLETSIQENVNLPHRSNLPFMVNDEPLYGLTAARQERRQRWMRKKGRK